MPTTEVVWQPTGAKRPIRRWVIAAAAVVTVIAWFNTGAPRGPDNKRSDASTTGATQAAVPARKPRTPSNVEPVRILNPAAQLDERINDIAARPLPARRTPADYQALRREMLTTD